MEYFRNINSPIGTLTLSSDGASVTGLWIEGQKYFAGTLGKDAWAKIITLPDNAGGLHKKTAQLKHEGVECDV